MPGITRINRRYNKNPARRKIQGVGAQTARAVRTPIAISSFSHSTVTGTVTFNQPVILTGVPAWVDSAAHTPVSAVMTSPTVMTIVFSGTITTPVTIPFEDPAIRNSAAGYVNAGSQVVT